MLIDKGYYDYDFSEEVIVKAKPKAELKPRSTKELTSILAKFGFKTKLRAAGEAKPLLPEEVQRIVMEELKEL